MDIDRIDINQLACAVLNRAVADTKFKVQDKDCEPTPTAHHRQALAFLGQPSEDLRFWCEAAGITEKSVLDKFAKSWQTEKGS